jgi:hypothetical protein
MELKYLRKRMHDQNHKDQIKLLYMFKNGVPLMQLKSWVKSNIYKYITINLLESSIEDIRSMSLNEMDINLKLNVLEYEDEFSILYSKMYKFHVAHKLEQTCIEATEDLLTSNLSIESINEKYDDIYYFLGFHVFSDSDLDDDADLKDNKFIDVMEKDGEKLRFKREDFAHQINFLKAYLKATD